MYKMYLELLNTFPVKEGDAYSWSAFYKIEENFLSIIRSSIRYDTFDEVKKINSDYDDLFSYFDELFKEWEA